MSYCQKRSRDKVESNLQITKLKSEKEEFEMKCRSRELELNHKNSEIENLESRLNELEMEVQIKNSSINNLNRKITENKLLSEDYASQG